MTVVVKLCGNFRKGFAGTKSASRILCRILVTLPLLLTCKKAFLTTNFASPRVEMAAVGSCWFVLLTVAAVRCSFVPIRYPMAPPLTATAVRVAPRTDANVVVMTAVDAATDEPAVRPPYVLTGLMRPTWRGVAMGWMHRTRTWYLVAMVYVALAARLSRLSLVPLSSMELFLRTIVAGASSANVFISDRYHNADKRGKRALTTEAETVWLRWDYIGISGVLTSLMWLWSSNVGWIYGLRWASTVSGLATLLVAMTSFLVVPRKAGHSTVKGILGFQFVVLLGRLAWLVATQPGRCSLNSILFLVYMPGLLLYAIKW